MHLNTETLGAKAPAPLPSANASARPAPPALAAAPQPKKSTGSGISMREVAHARAAEGFRVFPLIPGGKTPALQADWKRIATSDPEKVDELWTCPVTGWEQPYNIGVALDADTLVVDVDVRDGKEGKKNLLALMHDKDLEPLPTTYWVRTASKGNHHYFRVDGETKFKAKLTDHVDLKTVGGYVVAEGSVIDGIRYARVGEASPDVLADLPDEWVEAARATGEAVPAVGAGKVDLLVDLDEPAAVARATEFLNSFDPAIEGDGGDAHTYATAARVLDYGVSVDAALELMLDHWNDRCSPPWQPEDLKAKVENASKYRQNPVGVKAPEAEFEPVEVEDRRTLATPPVRPPPRFDFNPVEPFDLDSVPPRRWVVDRLAIRGTVSAIVAPGGAGKTTFLIMLAVATATGRDDILGTKVRERTPVFLWNQEDDDDELRRRLAAVMRAFDVGWDDLTIDGRPMLFVESGVGRPLLVAREQSGRMTPTGDLARIREFMAKNEIGLAIFDPLVEMSDIDDENNNAKMKAVAAIFRDQLASPTSSALLLAHHTKKPPDAGSDGFAGNPDAARGGSALVGVCRIVKTLFTIGPRYAKDAGIPDAERLRYVRLDDAKANPSLLAGTPTLFRREGVTLGGFGGEEVGVLRPESVDAIKKLFAGERRTARTRFVEAVRSAIAAEGGKATVMSVAEQLQRDIEFEARSVESIRKEIDRSLDKGATCDNGDTISLLKRQLVPGTKGRPNVLILTSTDKSEGLSAESSANAETAENR